MGIVWVDPMCDNPTPLFDTLFPWTFVLASAAGIIAAFSNKRKLLSRDRLHLGRQAWGRIAISLVLSVAAFLLSVEFLPALLLFGIGIFGLQFYSSVLVLLWSTKYGA